MFLDGLCHLAPAMSSQRKRRCCLRYSQNSRNRNPRTKELKKLVSFVRENDARKIFLCLTFMEVLRYLPDFLNAKFMDRDLPVREDGLISGNQLLDKTPFNIERHASNFPLEGKSRRNRSDFLEKQWYFLSPDCSNRSLEIHDFHSKLPMAYLPPWSDNDSISTSISISNFSVVWRVHLHPDHFGQHQVG